MAKSRVEKNKSLYDELESESFELEDIGIPTSEISEKKVESNEKKALPVNLEKKNDTKRQELIPVKKVKKNEIVPSKKKRKVEFVEEDFVVEQPISYTDKLSMEAILRAKLEQQQQLKDSKKLYKKSPITSTYTPEMMQKNINQKDGIDIRKEANIRVSRGSNLVVCLLVLLLIAVIIAGVVIGLVIIK